MFNLFYFNMCFSNSLIKKKFCGKYSNKSLIYSKFYHKKFIVLGRSYTFLTSSNIYNLQKRLHSGTPMQMFAKVKSPQALLEQKHLIRNKAIFLRFCQHFKEKSLAELLDDKVFITYVSDNINKEPMLFSRTFQLALEVSYFKRHFNQQILQEVYKNDFNLSSNDLIVNSTPLFLTKQKITEPMKLMMDYNKKMTENTCPDIEIKGRPYDFKEPKDTSFGKNQIYFLALDDFKDKGMNMLLKLENSLVSPQITLTEKAREFTFLITNHLQKQRETKIPIENRLEMLNKLFIESDVPRDFKMPLFIPVKKVNIDILTLEKMQVDLIPLEKGVLHQTKAKRAIMGVLDTYDCSIKSHIQQATHNSIQFSNNNLNDVD